MSVSLARAMRDHFVDATAARDAVIAGRLDAVRPPLQRIAAEEVSQDVPIDWQPWFEEMRVAAQKGAKATSLEGAANAVAALGATCGECHRTTRGGERKPDVVGGYQHGDKKGLEEKMARHKFAADELWLGLTGPIHQTWSEGAAALLNIRIPGLVTLSGTPATSDRAPSGEGSLQGKAEEPEPAGAENDHEPAPGVIDLDAALRELRDLGGAADRARIASEKQAVFGQIIARCGQCHAQAGVRLPLTPPAR